MLKIIDRYIYTDLGIARYNDKRGRYMLVKRGGVQIDLHKQVFRKVYGHNIAHGLEIHHRDCDKFNNHFRNLIALTHEEHQWVHQNVETVSYNIRVIENTIKDAKRNKKILTR